MFERFTDRARRVIVLAQQEAVWFGHGHIGTEHLLLGLIAEEEGVAAQALAAAGIDLDTGRQELDRLAGRSPVTPSGHMPFTAPAKQTLERSRRQSQQLGHPGIGPEHLLLGLLDVDDDTDTGAITLLRNRGVEPAALRASVLASIGEDAPTGVWRQDDTDADAADRRPERSVLVVPSHSTPKERLDEVVAAVRELSGCTPVVLHWQAGGPYAHQAIVDRYEDDGPEPAAAVVILGADDDASRRPGLDVVYELGWFHGSFGRHGVVVLVEEGVETPGSIGIPYYPLDPAGTWRRRLDDGLHAALDEGVMDSAVWAEPARMHRVTAPSYLVPGTGLGARLLRILSLLRYLWPWRR